LTIDFSSGKRQDGTANLIARNTSRPRTTFATATTYQQETPSERETVEKHKACRLLKRKLEAKRAKEERKRNLKMLQQDKLVRETDPNWKPEVSAACAKSGSDGHEEGWCYTSGMRDPAKTTDRPVTPKWSPTLAINGYAFCISMNRLLEKIG
jgi:hypothetical protein